MYQIQNTHEIDYRIIGEEMQCVEIELDPQETVIAEAGSLMMMDNDFLCGSHNIDEIDHEAEDFPIIKENIEKKINCFLSNSFGFGGTNGSIIIRRA